MTVTPSLGSLAKLDADYRDEVRYYTHATGKIETVSQKRKRLFNNETGSLNLSFKGLPFWIEDPDIHFVKHETTGGHCCFCHIVGLPRNPKTGKVQPIFWYQMELLHALFINDAFNPGNNPIRWKHVWVKKATGMGFTELMIYIMLYLPLAYPEEFNDSQMAIITGINMITAKRIMKRMKYVLYQKLRISFQSNDRVIDINGCIIECYPAVKPDTYRSLDNLKLAFYDEADFCPVSLIFDVRDALERYFAKSDLWLVVGSTANAPEGFMEQIENEPVDKCMYKKLYWLVDKGLGTMYTNHDIEIAMASDSFAREYLGEYRGLKGNLFKKEVLDYAAGFTDLLEVRDMQTKGLLRQIQRPESELSIREVINDYRYLGMDYETSIGIDPAWNSSKFAFLVNKKIGDLVYAVKEIELESPSVEEAVMLTKELMYDQYPWMHPKLYIDNYGIPFIRALKKEIEEDVDYHKMKPELLIESMMNPQGMVACPIVFNKWGDRMNYHFKRLFELGLYRVDPKITPFLWTGLTTARYDEMKNRFDKAATNKNDVYDGGRLAAINWKINNMGVLYV